MSVGQMLVDPVRKADAACSGPSSLVDLRQPSRSGSAFGPLRWANVGDRVGAAPPLLPSSSARWRWAWVPPSLDHGARTGAVAHGDRVDLPGVSDAAHASPRPPCDRTCGSPPRVLRRSCVPLPGPAGSWDAACPAPAMPRNASASSLPRPGARRPNALRAAPSQTAHRPEPAPLPATGRAELRAPAVRTSAGASASSASQLKSIVPARRWAICSSGSR